MIAQSFAGFGWGELVVRGLLIGVLFGALHRFFAARSHRWFYCAAYAWLTVRSYHSVRAVSLAPFVMFYLEALPVFVVMVMVRKYGARSGGRGRGLGR